MGKREKRGKSGLERLKARAGFGALSDAPFSSIQSHMGVHISFAYF